MVRFLVFCTKCGKQLAADDYYCPRCGVRTEAGKAAGVRVPTEEIRDAFAAAGKEMEKAFSQIAKEFDQAVTKVREGKVRIDCAKCGEKGIADADYCPKCGSKL